MTTFAEIDVATNFAYRALASGSITREQYLRWRYKHCEAVNLPGTTITAEVWFNIDKGEPRTHDYPGSGPSVSDLAVSIDGEEITELLQESVVEKLGAVAFAIYSERDGGRW